MDFVIVLAILTLVVLVVSAPLRRPGAQPAQELDEELAELEAERAAKYREIRDAELDHHTGKLSDADYAELNRELRVEAIDIMHKLDDAEQLPSHEA